MSRRGNPFDNAKAESLIKTLKVVVETRRAARHSSVCPRGFSARFAASLSCRVPRAGVRG